MPTGYRKASDLPQVIPVFPLDGALLLPGGQLPLNVFEPRYLNMLDDAMAGDRIIGMVQTVPGGDARGYLPSQLRLRRGVANSLPFEDLQAGTGSGFRFAAQAFARVWAQGDGAAIERAAQASLDNMATLEALARSAREARTVTLGAD